ncbi:MAG: hypothetical protein KGH78_04010 [Candidatus Micrarchaeota archaeon]|nr:hypothetical protein [Candidatus Micrarchaeota archaeon]
MRVRTIVISVALLALASLATVASAQSAFTSYNAFKNWFPVVGIAAFIGMLIAAVIYMVGYLLNENQLRARGISEFGQAVAALVFAIMIVVMLSFLGSVVSSTVVGSGIGAQVSNMCTGSLPYASVNLLQNNPQVPSPTGSVCSLVSATSTRGSADITPYVDYGLASSYVIIANLTSQAAQNLNGLYMYESMVGFLGSLQGVYGICEVGPTCLVPVLPSAAAERVFVARVTYQPFAGYGMLTLMTKPVEAQGVFIFYAFMVQLIIIMIIMQLWPYLLAGGIILRSISYTRATGGLLMGAAVASLIVLPIVIMIQYAALNNSSQLVPIGNVNPLPSFAVNGLPLGQQLNGPPCTTCTSYTATNMNFYVFPNITNVVNYNGCWPQDIAGGSTTSSDMVSEEIRDSAAISTVGIGNAIGYIFGGFLGNQPGVIGIGCSPDSAFKTAIDLTNIYGRMSVTGMLLPILDILVFIASVRNLSQLFGGDVSLAGIGKLV